MQGRPDRVRMTMFPEDGVEVPSTQMVHNQPTNLQRLSQPAQILKAIISGLATYQVWLGVQENIKFMLYILGFLRNDFSGAARTSQVTCKS